MKKRLLLLIPPILISLFTKAQIDDVYFPKERILKYKIKSVVVRDCMGHNIISKTLYNTRGNKTYQIVYQGGLENFFYQFDSSGNYLKITYANGDIADKYSNTYDQKGRLVKSIWINKEYSKEFRKIIYLFEYNDQNQVILEKEKYFAAHSSYKEKRETAFSNDKLFVSSSTGVYWHLPDPIDAKYNDSALIIQAGNVCYEYEYY